MKPHGLIATPSINSVIIKEKQPINNLTQTGAVKEVSEIAEHDLYLVLASDGIWDECDDEDLMRIFVRENIYMSTKDLAKILLKNAVDKGSTDNISVIVVKL